MASPEAAQLAILCSPYSQVSLPLLNLIRQELVPDATVGDIAELIVGGLVTATRTATGRPVLLFRDGVQAPLQQMLSEHDAWRVYETLSRYIADHAGRPTGFVAAAYDPQGSVQLPGNLQPFAEASQQVLRLLGALPDGARSTPQALDLAEAEQIEHVSPVHSHAHAAQSTAGPATEAAIQFVAVAISEYSDSSYHSLADVRRNAAELQAAFAQLGVPSEARSLRMI